MKKIQLLLTIFVLLAALSNMLLSALPIVGIGLLVMLCIWLFITYIQNEEIRTGMLPLFIAVLTQIIFLTLAIPDQSTRTIVVYFVVSILLASFYPFAQPKLRLNIKEIPKHFIDISLLSGILLAIVGYFFIGKRIMFFGSNPIESAVIPLGMAIIEELLFRKYMLSGMLAYVRPVYAVLLTIIFSLAFAPVSDIKIIAFSAFSQLILSLLFLRTRSLFHSTAANTLMKYALVFVVKG